MSEKIVIFDLDGTLLNTLSDLHDSTNYALRSVGLPERSIDEVRRFVGNGIRKLIERAVPSDCAPETLECCFECFKTHYSAHCMETTAPYPGIAELLCALKGEGCALGVVSNKADAPAKALVAHYFPNVFDSVVGERENVRKKPAPDAVLETLRSLGGDIESCVYVGDSDVDFHTAQNAGCRVVLVSWGFKTREFLDGFGAAVADDARQLLELINGGECNEN